VVCYNYDMKTNLKVTDMNLPTWTVPIWYRGFRIYYDRSAYTHNDWSFVHDDYDGAEDNRSGSEASLEACKETIDELFFD
jgi:hypothetical protein